MKSFCFSCITDKDGDFVQRQSPSRLAPEPRKERRLFSRLLTSVLVLALAALMLFFLWLVCSALEQREPPEPAPASAAASPTASDEADLALAQAQAIAEAVHDAMEEAFPMVKHCMVHVNPANP